MDGLEFVSMGMGTPSLRPGTVSPWFATHGRRAALCAARSSEGGADDVVSSEEGSRVMVWALEGGFARGGGYRGSMDIPENCTQR